MRLCRETNWVRHIHLIANGRLPRTYSIGCPIGSSGVPHQAVVRAGEWEREAARRVDAGARSFPAWRIGMTAPVIERTGAVSLRKRKPGFWPGESKIFRNVMKREHLRSEETPVSVRFVT